MGGTWGGSCLLGAYGGPIGAPAGSCLRPLAAHWLAVQSGDVCTLFDPGLSRSRQLGRLLGRLLGRVLGGHRCPIWPPLVTVACEVSLSAEPAS
eukprot:scaffold14982_cov62-Phaeocystis_antarctica.AAC.8